MTFPPHYISSAWPSPFCTSWMLLPINSSFTSSQVYRIEQGPSNIIESVLLQSSTDIETGFPVYGKWSASKSQNIRLILRFAVLGCVVWITHFQNKAARKRLILQLFFYSLRTFFHLRWVWMGGRIIYLLRASLCAEADMQLVLSSTGVLVYVPMLLGLLWALYYFSP